MLCLKGVMSKGEGLQCGVLLGHMAGTPSYLLRVAGAVKVFIGSRHL